MWATFRLEMAGVAVGDMLEGSSGDVSLLNVENDRRRPVPVLSVLGVEGVAGL